jgi:hypothetical protein
MGKMNVGAILLAAVLGLGPFQPRVTAQENDKQTQTETREKQESTRKTTPSRSLSAYRLEFALTEVEDGKKIKGRNYSMLVQEGEKTFPNKLRIGARVPVTTGPGEQFQYMDVGMNIDCWIEERDNQLGLYTVIDASSIVLPEEQKAQPVARQPVLHSMRSEIHSVVSSGKPTLISSMDDPSSTRRFQLEGRQRK